MKLKALTLSQLPAIQSILFDTLKGIDSYSMDFVGYQFYGISKSGRLDQIVSTIKENRLFISHVDFNDAVDPLYSIFSFLHRNKGSKQERQWFALLHKAMDNFRISCLVSERDKKGHDNIENLLMWPHYADWHKGICVKYRIQQGSLYCDESRRQLCVLKPISYKYKKVRVDSITLEDAFFLKSAQWSYEDEYRILFYSESKPKSEHYVENVGIEGVYLGVKISPKKRAYILKELKDSGVPLFQMKYNRDDVLRISPVRIDIK